MHLRTAIVALAANGKPNLTDVMTRGGMKRWLFKSEPNVWSWSDQLKKGEVGEEWDGVRNYQARNNMREMKLGDLGFFYHSQTEKAVVGVVEVCALCHRDSTTDDERWECVDVKAVTTMPNPVTLAMCKSDRRLAQMVLVNNSRLSVQPVMPDEWNAVCELGGVPLGSRIYAK